MNGEGSIPFSKKPVMPYKEALRAFDRRPGALEATRIEPASGILVCGSRCVEGMRGPWQVMVTVRGADGLFCQVRYDAAGARELAAELVEMAEIIEGKRW